MKKNLLFVLLFLVATILVVFSNLGQIPTGTEMGAIGIMFFTVVVSAFIFFITIGIGAFLSSLFTNNAHSILFLIYVIGLGIIFYSSRKICLVGERSLSFEEQRISYKEHLEEDKKTALKFLSEGEVFFPAKEIVAEDKLLIKNEFKSFISNLPKKRISDSLYTGKDFYLLQSFYFENKEDSNEIIVRYKNMLETIRVDLILYSPDYKKFISFISFNTIIEELNYPEPRSLTLVLIGKKSDNKMTIYYHTTCSWGEFLFPNQESSYYNTLISLSENMSENANPPSLVKKIFWQTNDLFGMKKIDNETYYNFELKNLDSNKIIIAPRIIIQK